MREKGILIVVSGFSGSGKGTIMKELLKQYDNYALSISATTRNPRPGEEDGREYFFKTVEDFEKMIQQIIKEKNRIFLEQPLTANPKKFKGIKIEDAELTLRSTRILLSRKYKTLEQVAKLSRSQLIALSKYGFMRKSMIEITDL